MSKSFIEPSRVKKTSLGRPAASICAMSLN